MGKYRIVIEGEGPHGNQEPTDADKVAKDTALTLHAMKHGVTKAGITFIDEEGQEGTEQSFLAELPVTVAAENRGTGEDDETGSGEG